eukprot:TRINITY_DN65354_c0_g1_i1.p1 TRINITY_DN65354_c0_g1~~TRINITY_DN65354_c0_g1_i1.p1  ORF type:complete len:449 (-),score=101.48 TRINITY_DN65354_c0_g1_i1:14-1192(-)
MKDYEIRSLFNIIDKNNTGRVAFHEFAEFVTGEQLATKADCKPSLHRGWTEDKIEKAGVCTNVALIATLPYTAQPHIENPEMLLTTCNVYRCPDITNMVHEILESREVAGLEGVTFGDVCDLVLNKGASRIYTFGGFLRDAFCGVVSDDMDFLVRSTGGSVIPFLENTAKSRGWPVYRKKDERTDNPRWDFIAIGDKDHKMKWSAHPCGSGCEGDFCMNSMLYDIKSGALIDPTGYGIQDSVNFVLRHNRGTFEEWVEEDRLPGMKLIRYFNFCSRGYSPSDAEFRNNIVKKTLVLLSEVTGQTTIKTFFKRKIFRGGLEKALAKEADFRSGCISEMGKAGTMSKKEACEWYMQHIAPLYKDHLLDGMEDKLVALLAKQAQNDGVADFQQPW